MILETRDLQVTFSGRPILRGIDLGIAEGTVTSIVGPNGCGKSTLLRSMARILRPGGGRIMLGDADLWSLPPRHCARRIGFLPQTPQTPEGIRVRALVERGRTPFLHPFRGLSRGDRDAVDRAMALAGLTDLAARRVDRLSGGQRQRVWLALVLAQQTDLILLDEPTTFLDLPHQVAVLRLVRELNRAGRTVVMVLHDLNLAAQFSDRIVGLRDGRVVMDGPPARIVTEAAVRRLFDMEARILAGDGTHPPVVMPRP